MLKLRVTFTGIVAFVQGFKRVVIPGASTPRQSRNNSNIVIPAHFPYVRFKKENIKSLDFNVPVQAMYKRPKRENITEFETINSVVCFLKNMQVSIASNVTSSHAVNNDKPQNEELPHPDTTEKRSVHWVARLDRALASAGEMNPAYFTDMPPLNIAAFMKLDRAKVETAFMPFDRKFAFTPNTSGYKRGLAIGVDATFELHAAETDLKLEFTSFDPEDGGKLGVVLVPEGNDPIDIVVGNAPLEAILQVGHVHECVNGMPNYDFELFYGLSRREPNLIWPIPVCERVGPPKELGGEYCPPVQMGP